MLGLCAFVVGTFWQNSKWVPTADDLNRLVTLYQELHLPVPPANAPLADRGYRHEGPRLSLVDCGYAVPGKNKHGWYTIFLGIEPDEDPNPAKPVTPDAKNFASLEYELRDYDRFSQADAGLAIAVIERLRGHNDFALAIYRKWAGKADHPEYGPRKSEPGNPRQTLAELALLHWFNMCLYPDSDRSVIAVELKNLAKRFPKIEQDTAVEGKGTVASTIERLELTVNNRYHGNDKVEQLIDSLCDGKADGGEIEGRGLYFTEHDFDTIRALASIGYKAIPQLIAHFDDNRLVRSNSEGSKGFHSGDRSVESACPITTVGTVCANLVTQFSNGAGDFGGGSYNKQAQRKWWAEASKKSEVDNCWTSLTAKKDYPSEGPMWFAQAHHPEMLLKALDVVLARKDKTQIYGFLGALVRSNLDRKVVIDALVKASKSSISDQAHAGVVFLKKVSPSESDAALIRILRDLPKSSLQKAWLSREASYGKSVAESDSPEVWSAYFEATKRADLDLRLEMIQNAAYAEFTPTTTKLFLKYLSAFFDDKAQATEPKEMMNRQHFDLPSLRVQYLALILAAYQVDVKPIPKKTASAAEWTTFRKAVEANLAKKN
ncbi:MAG: hypothetical protein WCI55_13445 [Armatimonadota bacterium]